MALVTTFATTPLTMVLFPPSYQKKLAAWKLREIDWNGTSLSQDTQSLIQMPLQLIYTMPATFVTYWYIFD